MGPDNPLLIGDEKSLSHLKRTQITDRLCPFSAYFMCLPGKVDFYNSSCVLIALYAVPGAVMIGRKPSVVDVPVGAFSRNKKFDQGDAFRWTIPRICPQIQVLEVAKLERGRGIKGCVISKRNISYNVHGSYGRRETNNSFSESADKVVTKQNAKDTCLPAQVLCQSVCYVQDADHSIAPGSLKKEGLTLTIDSSRG